MITGQHPHPSKDSFPVLFLSFRAPQDLATSGPETDLHPEGWGHSEPTNPIPGDHTNPVLGPGQGFDLETELGLWPSFWPWMRRPIVTEV